MGLAAVGFFQGRTVSFVIVQFDLLGVIADSEYVDCMGNNGTSILYANSSGLDDIRLLRYTSTVACITPAISLTLVSSRSTVVYSGSTSPLDDGVFWH